MSETLPPGDPMIRVTAMPADTNCYGDIFGGWLIGQMDLAAGALASLECEGRAVTVAIDAISFHRPVKVGNEVSIFAKLESIGRTSMKISATAWQRERNNRESHPVTEALFTFVAVDTDGKARRVTNICVDSTDRTIPGEQQ